LNPQPSEPQSDALPVELLPPQTTIIAIAARVRLVQASENFDLDLRVASQATLLNGRCVRLSTRIKRFAGLISSLVSSIPSGAAMRKLIFSLFYLLFSTAIVSAQQYDLVLEGGRVMDPETGLDAVRNVGVRDGKIARIASETLSGRRIVHADGLVVAPGFIDLHQHGQDAASQRVKALDGVTTALEMEIGVPDVAQFLQAKAGHSLINYGTSASHVAARALVFGAPLPSGEILPKSGPATDRSATPEQIEAIRQRLRAELDAGGLAVGMGIQYTPGATRLEVIDMFRLAAERALPVYTHVRSVGRVEPGSSIESISEVIGAAAITGASLHIVHINSSCLQDSLECLSMVEGARARGLDVTTEAYPYIPGMTAINSALFNPGWQEKLGISYPQLVLPDTGEHLTKERFEELHNSSKTSWVLIYANTQEVVDKVIPHPLVMIASDGAEGHPRNAGTYSRVLAQYVREKGTITLMDALRKMTLMPAQMLERSTPAARQKGRLQQGVDADIVVFDPATISDRSTFQKPMEPSIGVHYLLVGGTAVVDDGKIVPDVFPGRALLGPSKRAGSMPSD
jgi:cytosine/adenosine deaminase-related metal-dependent hydrolase